MSIDEISVFVKVVQAGSFTRAARLLGLTKSTASARVAALERRLQTRLLHRTTRRLRLTPEGEAFHRTCESALAELEAAENALAKTRVAPGGVLRVSVPTAFSIHCLPRVLGPFLARYPEIQLRLTVTNRFVDLVEEGIDVAIRAGALADSSLVATRLGTSRLSLFASPAYLARAGTPRRPADLARHHCLSFAAEASPWRLTRQGKTTRVPIPETARIDDLTTLTALAVQGARIAIVADFCARDEVVAKRLVPVLPEWHAHETGIYAVLPSRRHPPDRVRLFLEAIAQGVRDEFPVGL